MTSMASDDVVDENRPINKLAAFMRTNNNEKQRGQRALVPLQTMDTNRLSQPTATLDDFDHDESPIKNEGLKTSEPPMILLQPVVLSPILHNSDNSGYLLEIKNSGMKTIPLYEEDDEQDDVEEGSTWRERSTLHDNEEVSTTRGVEMDEKKKELHDGGDGEVEDDVLPGLLDPTDRIPSQMPSQMVEDLDASVVIVEGEMVPMSDTNSNGDVGVDEGMGARAVTDFIPPYTTEHQHQLSPSYHHTSPSSSLSSSSTSTSIHHDTSKDLDVYDNAYAATTTTAADRYPSPSQYGTTVHYPSPSSQSSHQSHQHTAVSPSGYIEFIPPPPPVPITSTTMVPVFGTKGVPGTQK